MDDPDTIVRCAERDPAEAVACLVAGLAVAEAVDEDELPDRLAAALRGGEEVAIGA